MAFIISTQDHSLYLCIALIIIPDAFFYKTFEFSLFMSISCNSDIESLSVQCIVQAINSKRILNTALQKIKTTWLVFNFTLEHCGDLNINIQCKSIIL